MPERTTVRLPADLIARAKRKAASEGRSLTALIEDGVRRVVNEPSTSPPDDRSPLPVSSAKGGLIPGLSWDDLKHIEELEDLDSLRRSN